MLHLAVSQETHSIMRLAFGASNLSSCSVTLCHALKKIYIEALGLNIATPIIRLITNTSSIEIPTCDEAFL